MMNREIPKALRNAFIVHFWADMLFAVPLMIAPIGLLELMGWDVVDPLTARVVAAALFGIGSESLLGRNGDFDHFRGMLRLKVIWSSAVLLGIVLSVLDGGWGQPLMLWVVAGIFLVFNVLWVYWWRRINSEIQH